MTDVSEDHEGTVSTGGRPVINFHFSDDIGSLAGQEDELAKLVEHLDLAATAYGRATSAKLMTNNASAINKKYTDKSAAQASGTWAQLYLTSILSLKYSPGWYRQHHY